VSWDLQVPSTDGEMIPVSIFRWGPFVSRTMTTNRWNSPHTRASYRRPRVPPQRLPQQQPLRCHVQPGTVSFQRRPSLNPTQRHSNWRHWLVARYAGPDTDMRWFVLPPRLLLVQLPASSSPPPTATPLVSSCKQVAYELHEYTNRQAQSPPTPDYACLLFVFADLL